MRAFRWRRWHDPKNWARPSRVVDAALPGVSFWAPGKTRTRRVTRGRGHPLLLGHGNCHWKPSGVVIKWLTKCITPQSVPLSSCPETKVGGATERNGGDRRWLWRKFETENGSFILRTFGATAVGVRGILAGNQFNLVMEIGKNALLKILTTQTGIISPAGSHQLHADKAHTIR